MGVETYKLGLLDRNLLHGGARFADNYCAKERFLVSAASKRESDDLVCMAKPKQSRYQGAAQARVVVENKKFMNMTPYERITLCE
jgi:hypothetical protein